MANQKTTAPSRCRERSGCLHPQNITAPNAPATLLRADVILVFPASSPRQPALRGSPAIGSRRCICTASPQGAFFAYSVFFARGPRFLGAGRSCVIFDLRGRMITTFLSGRSTHHRSTSHASAPQNATKSKNITHKNVDPNTSIDPVIHSSITLS